MKKIIALIAVVTIIASSLTGCMTLSSLPFSFEDYENADQYIGGDREITDRVENIDLDWSAGKVSLKTYSGDSISLRETISGNVPDDYRVHSWVDGTTLRIRFAKSGFKNVLNLGKKELEILVPEDMELTELKIHHASGHLDCIGVPAEKLHIDSASGGVNVESISSEISIGHASGSLDFLQSAEIKSFELDHSSGGTRLDFAFVPEKLKVHSASGGLTIKLPEDAGFTLNLDQSTGVFDYELPIHRYDDTYVCGDERAQFDIDIATGGLHILKH